MTHESAACLFSFQIGSKHYCFLEHKFGLVLDMSVAPEHPDFRFRFSWQWCPYRRCLRLSANTEAVFGPELKRRMMDEYSSYVARMAAGADE